jgi:hypothetical protein
MSVLNRPRIEAYIGASGSGKGVSINALLKEEAPKRLLIWDPRDEYAAHATKVITLKALVQHVQAARNGFRVRYVPGDSVKLAEAFGIVCALAFRLGNLLFLAEELSDVTTASLAPPAWKKCITQGRHQGLHIVGAAQRPALIDKTFLGNCTYIRCFTLRYADDRKAMAKALDVPELWVGELQTVEEGKTTVINYIERHFRSGAKPEQRQIRLTRGR